MCRELGARMRRLGILMNESKTQAWTRAGREALPMSLQRFWTERLKVVGSLLVQRGGRLDEEEAAGFGDDGEALAAVTEKLGVVGQEIMESVTAGLTWQEASGLLRWAGGGLPTHVLRAYPHTAAQCAAYDGKLRSLWEEVYVGR